MRTELRRMERLRRKQKKHPRPRGIPTPKKHNQHKHPSNNFRFLPGRASLKGLDLQQIRNPRLLASTRIPKHRQNK